MTTCLENPESQIQPTSGRPRSGFFWVFLILRCHPLLYSRECTNEGLGGMWCNRPLLLARLFPVRRKARFCPIIKCIGIRRKNDSVFFSYTETCFGARRKQNSRFYPQIRRSTVSRRKWNSCFYSYTSECAGIRMEYFLNIFAHFDFAFLQIAARVEKLFLLFLYSHNLLHTIFS